MPQGALAISSAQFKEFPDFYEAYYNEGIAETQLHQENNALQSFQKAIDLSGGHYARAYVGYRLVLVQLGRSEEAEPIVRQGLEEDPSLSDGHAVLSLVLFNQNRLDDGEEAAPKALRMPDPAVKNAVLMLAHIHLKRGEYRSAVQDLEDYLQTVCPTPCEDNTESTQYVRKLLSEAKAKSVGQDPAGEPRANIR
jgi:tetratricopeptide (TPR) repeat protein